MGEEIVIAGEIGEGSGQQTSAFRKMEVGWIEWDECAVESLTIPFSTRFFLWRL